MRRSIFSVSVIMLLLSSVAAVNAITAVESARTAFQLTATGSANLDNTPVPVVLTVSGDTQGNPKYLMPLKIQEGTLSVDGTTFQISGGNAKWIQPYQFLCLYLKLSPLDGNGPPRMVRFYGTTGTKYGAEFPITLYASYAVLPTTPPTTLYGLKLQGTLTLL